MLRIGVKPMENYTSNNKDVYIQRMNQTAKSKFTVVEPYLSKRNENS